MKNTWDLPADCNEGELFAYAETLYDNVGGEGKDALHAYLDGVRTDNLECRRPRQRGRYRRPRARASPRTGADIGQSRRFALPCPPAYGRKPGAGPARSRGRNDAAVAQW